MLPTLVLPYTVGGIACLALALAVWRKRPAKGARTYVVVLALLAWLAFAEGRAEGSTSFSAKVFWTKATYVSLVCVPVAWLVFVLRFSRGRTLSWREVARLGLEPAITLLLVWTNEAHGLMWSDMWLDRIAAPAGLHVRYGPWMWVHTLYSYLIGGYAAFALLQARNRIPHPYRRQALHILVAGVAPAAAAGVYVFAPDWGPTAMAGAILFSSALVTWSLLQMGLFELKPLALRALMAQMQDGYIVVDVEQRIVDWNLAAQEALGLQGAVATRRAAARGLSAYPILAAHGNAEGYLQRGFGLGCGDGYRHLDVRSTPLNDEAGQLVGRLIVLRDVTALQSADLALSESEEQYRTLVERANDGIVIIQDHRILYANPRLTEITGYTLEETVGEPFLQFLWPDVREQLADRYRRRMAGEEVPAIYDAALRHRDGSRVAVELNAGLATFKGQPAELVMVRDIRERVDAREQLARKADELQRELTERRAAEQTARQKAAELAALQSTVLDITAPHELPVLLEKIVERACALLHAPAGGLYLCDPDKEQVHCVVSHNTPNDYHGTILEYGEGAAGTVAKTGRPLIIDDHRSWSDRAEIDQGEKPFTAAISAPMIWQGEVTGVIQVLAHAGERHFAGSDRDLLTLFASHAAVAVANARLRDEAQRELSQRQKVQEFSEGIITSMTEGLLIEDENGTITFANAALQRMVGLTEEELLGQPWTVIVPESEVEPIRERMAQRSADATDRYETALLSRDGREVPVLLGARPLLADGHLSGILSTFMDISDRKRLEAETEERRLYLERVLEYAPDAVITLNRHSRVVEWNAGAERLFGYTAEEARGRDIDDLVAGPDPATLEQARALSETLRAAGGVEPLEAVRYRKDGSPVHVILAAAPILVDGQLAGIVGVYTDVTELRRLQEQMAERSAYLESVLASAPDAIVTLDEQAHVVEWNLGAQRLFGYSPEETRGRLMDDLVAPAAGAGRRRASQLTEQLMSGEQLPPTEVIRYRKDGVAVETVLTAAPFRLNGHLSGIVAVYSDVSELRRLENESEERRQYLESVLTSAPDAIITLDWDGRIAEWNLGAEKLFGYTPDEARGHKINRLIAGTDDSALAQAEKFSRQVFEGQPLQPTETTRYRKDGSPVRVIVSGAPILVDGLLKGIVGVYTDISERERAAQKLRRSEERYRAVVEDQTDLVTRFRPDGTLTFVNEAACRFVGKTREQMLGESLFADMPEEDRQAVRDGLRLLGPKNPVVIMTNRVLTGDGQVRWVQWTDRAVFDDHGMITEVQSVGRDVTLQRLAQEQLREAEAKYRSLVETSPDMITMTDVQGNVMLCNQQAARLHGFGSAEEMVGIAAINLIAPEDHQRAAQNLERTLAEGSIHNVEYSFLRKDGSEFPAELSASVIRDAEGAPVAFIGVTRDITEHKQAQERLEASLQEKDLLLREVHHRVKNNLQIISSLLYLQSLRARKGDDVRGILQDSRMQVQSMALVHEKLYGAQDLARVDFGEYVRGLTDSLVQSHGASAGHIAIDVAIGDEQLTVDQALPCGLIVNELVANALRHAFPDGQQGKIAIRLAHSNGNYVLRVDDDGTGLPPDFDSVTTESLGMQLVKTLVEQLDGTLEIESAGGAQFSIVFPAANGRTEASDARAPTEASVTMRELNSVTTYSA